MAISCAAVHHLVKNTLDFLLCPFETAARIPKRQESVALAKPSASGPLQLISNPTKDSRIGRLAQR
jgi:hypothetical protein